MLAVGSGPEQHMQGDALLTVKEMGGERVLEGTLQDLCDIWRAERGEALQDTHN